MNDRAMNIASVEAREAAGSLLAQHVTLMENLVDELKAQAEREEGAQLIDSAQAAAAGSSSGMVMTTVIIVLALAVILFALVFLGKYRRQQAEKAAEHEAPSFGDAYAVHDDDISIETESPAYAAPLTATDDAPDRHALEPSDDVEPDGLMIYDNDAEDDAAPAPEEPDEDDEAAEGMVIYADDDDEDTGTEDERGHIAATQEDDDGEAVTATAEDEPEPAPEPAGHQENVIPLMKRTTETYYREEPARPDAGQEAYHEQALGQDNAPTYRETASQALHAGEDADDYPPRETDVRYAFGGQGGDARRQPPRRSMGFSGISAQGSSERRHNDGGHGSPHDDGGPSEDERLQSSRFGGGQRPDPRRRGPVFDDPAPEEAPHQSYREEAPDAERDTGRDAAREAPRNDYQSPRRSYIAPTVLREDLSRLERMQAERFDLLHDEVSRQMTSLKSDQNYRFDIIVDALDRKLAKMADFRYEPTGDADADTVGPMVHEFNRQVTMLQSTLDTQAQRVRAITQILDDRLGTVGHVYGEVRSIGEKIDAFNARLNDMEQAMAEARKGSLINDVHLSDVIRSSLAPDQYEFKTLLSNNHRADCLIRMPRVGPIVVDAKFPVEAWNALPGKAEKDRDRHQARSREAAFRRAVMRHIIDTAERFIVAGETAEGALMYVPSEVIYTDIHSRFPDIVSDAFRAHVWLVSPSTLMGTLQTLRGVLHAPEPAPAPQAVSQAPQAQQPTHRNAARPDDYEVSWGPSEDEARTRRAAQERAAAQEQARLDHENAEREKAEQRAAEDAAVEAEIRALRERAATLAESFQTAQSELRAIVDATDRVFTRPELTTPRPDTGDAPQRQQPSPGGERRQRLVSELYDEKAEWPGSTEQYRGDTDKPRSFETVARRKDPLR